MVALTTLMVPLAPNKLNYHRRRWIAEDIIAIKDKHYLCYITKMVFYIEDRYTQAYTGVRTWRVPVVNKMAMKLSEGK